MRRYLLLGLASVLVAAVVADVCAKKKKASDDITISRARVFERLSERVFSQDIQGFAQTLDEWERPESKGESLTYLGSLENLNGFLVEIAIYIGDGGKISTKRYKWTNLKTKVRMLESLVEEAYANGMAEEDIPDWCKEFSLLISGIREKLGDMGIHPDIRSRGQMKGDGRD